MEEMASTNLYLIEGLLRSIYYLFLFFVIIRIIAFWINLVAGNETPERQEKLLEEILKELKDKNKE
jgi:hypothetical protein